MKPEDIISILFGIVWLLFRLAITIFYWQLMAPLWVAITYAGLMKGKRFRNTAAWAIFILGAWLLTHEFPADTKIKHSSWRDHPDESDRGSSGFCGKTCGE